MALTPEVTEEIERLSSYWECHQHNPEAVSKWALPDLLGLLRLAMEGD